MKFFTSILTLLFSAALIQAQAPIDFETPGHGADWTWTVFENDSNPALEIVSNPASDAVNSSATVAQFTALVTGQPFAGCESQHGADIGTFTLTPATSLIKIMVHKTTISDVGIKLVDVGGGSLGEIKVSNTLVNQWEELSFDFSSREGIEYDQIVIFPDFFARDTDNIIYFDNITFGEQVVQPMPLVAAPDPTEDSADVISMFSNVYTDVPVTTWITTWSSGVYSELQVEGNDTKKYDALDFIGIETTGADVIDASSMDFFHIDVWSPNVSLFRVKLVDFGADGEFGGGDDSEHEVVFETPAQNEWISYQIPMTDFPGLASSEHIAQLILSGQPVGAGTVYVDNVYFSSFSSGVEDVQSPQFSISPNPTQGFFNLNAEKSISDVRVFDSKGTLVKTVSQSGMGRAYDISELPSGTYIIEVLVEGVPSSSILIKEN